MQNDNPNLSEMASEMANKAKELAEEAASIATQATDLINQAAGHGDGFFVNGLTVFILACFVGYYVVWRVTPALHSPLMAVTNAISSVIIVGALLAVGAAGGGASKFMGFLAVVLASINIFGGFIVSQRMLHMFKKKE